MSAWQSRKHGAADLRDRHSSPLSRGSRTRASGWPQPRRSERRVSCTRPASFPFRRKGPARGVVGRCRIGQYTHEPNGAGRKAQTCTSRGQRGLPTGACCPPAQPCPLPGSRLRRGVLFDPFSGYASSKRTESSIPFSRSLVLGRYDTQELSSRSFEVEVKLHEGKRAGRGVRSRIGSRPRLSPSPTHEGYPSAAAVSCLPPHRISVPTCPPSGSGNL